MSVSFPGSDVLSAPVYGPSSSTASPSTANAGGTQTIGSDVPGADALTAQTTAASVPGLTNIGVIPGTAAASQQSSQNVYEQTFASVESWSAGYLESSAMNGAPATLPEYTAGGSASMMASLSNMMAEVQQGMAAGVYGGGTGSIIDATA